MRLREFRVKGFRNLTQWVALEDLGPINVIHGDNNVGKSNILEAMQWFFHFIGLESEGFLPIVKPLTVAAGYLVGRRTVADAFNVDAPYEIELQATLETDPIEFEQAGIRQLIDATSVTIGMVFTPVGDSVSYQVRLFRFADGTDATGVLESADKKAFVLRFAKYLAREHFADSKERFALIPADRGSPAASGPITERLSLALYDAKEATTRSLHQAWARFAAAMSCFSDKVGDGSFNVVYNREKQRAYLVVERASDVRPEEQVRLLAESQGTGIQQIAALVGDLVTTHSSIVAIEEPELNLRYALQLRLRDLFEKDLIEKAGGPSQLLITSHSPAFEAGTHFYSMETTPDGLAVTRRPVSEARAATAVDLEAPPSIGPRSPGYVSSEGLVALPERVRKRLGIEKGGGVMFVDASEWSIEMLSDSEYLRRFADDSEGTAK